MAEKFNNKVLILGAGSVSQSVLPLLIEHLVDAKQITIMDQRDNRSRVKGALDKGSMATIGRNKAVVQVRWFKLAGPLAWLVWLWLHLFYLLGGRNKIGTMADWTWNYLTFDRGNRHIMDSQ